MPKFKVGDKVIPKTKSIGCQLYEDNHWKRAKNANQPYMYIARKITRRERPEIENKQAWALNEDETIKNGNHYLENDLIPYIEEGLTLSDYFEIYS